MIGSIPRYEPVRSDDRSFKANRIHLLHVVSASRARRDDDGGERELLVFIVRWLVNKGRKQHSDVGRRPANETLRSLSTVL